MTEPLHELSTAKLKALASSLRSGSLSLGISKGIVQQITGNNPQSITDCLNTLSRSGMSPAHIATIVEAIITSRERAISPDQLVELVLSGPEVSGVPTNDTSATMQSLIAEATKEILLVGYAVHNARGIFAPLAKRMSGTQGLRVTFCLDIARKLGDTSLDSEIIKRFAIEFKEKHWPWKPLPDMYYDPRSLSGNSEHRSSLHAKCIVVDRRAALVTSANFTEAAQQRNIEVGVLVRHVHLAARVVDYFAGLIDKKAIVPIKWSSHGNQAKESMG